MAQYTPRVALRLGNLCLGRSVCVCVCVSERGRGMLSTYYIHHQNQPTKQKMYFNLLSSSSFLFCQEPVFCWMARAFVCGWVGACVCVIG